MTQTLNHAWYDQLYYVYHRGEEVSPRGKLTKELPQRTLVFDMNHPVVTWEVRKLGYKFMAAEAWWILSGHDDVASIAPYSKRISDFSDNGETFFGSYGPPFVNQLGYVVETLMRDVDTRQALMTFWRPNPPKTKDVPCTITVGFQIRNGLLNMHVFMRSSDNWLGIPYDAFNFSMMSCLVLEQLNQTRDPGQKYLLGSCYLTAASSHLYETNFEDVRKLLLSEWPKVTLPVPTFLYGIYPQPADRQYRGVKRHLELMKDNESYRWWHGHAA